MSRKKYYKDGRRGYILGTHSAYLTENMLMLLILLFIVSITLAGFLKIQTLRRETEEQLQANLIAQNFIEYGKAAQVDYEEEKHYFYYDKNWEEVIDKEDGRYTAEIVINQEILKSGILKKIQVNIYRKEAEGEKLIYNLCGNAY